MVSMMSLWLPILLSAVAVFIASSIVHMLLRYHRSDVARIAGEDQVRSAMREAGVAPGDYVIPYAGSPGAMKDPSYVEKVKQGPIAFVTIFPPSPTGSISMTGILVQWFLFCLVVSVFAGYVASRAVGTGGEFAEVLRFAGTTAFAGYALGLIPNSIWWKRKWSSTVKGMFDGLIYALITGAVFAWMWPAG